MVKLCEDFIYEGQSISELGFTAIDFHNDEEIPLYLKREITKGEVNPYRKRANHIHASFTDSLEFELHLIKKNYNRKSLSDLELSKEEIRTVVGWLTSVPRPALLQLEDSQSDDDLFLCGLFTNVETYTIGGKVYGLILTFSNDSPFAYSDIIADTFTVQEHTARMITNNSDLLDDYCYPVIRISPVRRSDFFICNLSDSHILAEGKLAIASDPDVTFDNFLDKIEDYAARSSYTTAYYYGSDNAYATHADRTAIRFKYIDSHAACHHCFAFHKADGSYTILEGGFLTLKVLAGLPVTIDCELLTIYDDLGRMVSFKDIGIDEEDYIYWPRLRSNDNAFLFYGADCTVTFTRREMIKAGVL